MREILFRGKRIDNGEWVEGSLAVDKNRCYICKSVSDLGVSYGDNGTRMRIGCWFPVDSSTVGQYTGLKDKNGKKIFEGDIIDASEEWWDACGPAGHDSPIMLVEWAEWNCGFDPFANYDCDCGVYICANNCEVIGNIHDNPELIGENDETNRC